MILTLVSAESISIPITALLKLLPVLFSIYYGFLLFGMKSFGIGSSRLLSVFFFLLGAVEMFFFMDSAGERLFSVWGYDGQIKYFLPLLVAVVISLAPTMYLYLRSQLQSISTNQDIHTKYIQHYYLALGLGVLCAILMSGIGLIERNTPLFDMTFNSLYALAIGSFVLLFPLQNIFYISKSLKAYNEHKKLINQFYSYEDGVVLNWISVLIYGYIAFIVVMISSNLIHNEFGSILFDSIILAYMIYIGYSGMKQLNHQIGAQEREILSTVLDWPMEGPIQDVTANAQIGAVKSNKEQEVKSKYATSSLQDENKIKELKELLVEYMENDRPYLNTQLTIYDIAVSLSINHKYLSQVINNELGTNFIGFINAYRVAEAKRLLKSQDLKNYTIEALAEMAGFKSKSTFNAVFKKFVDKTPSDFKASTN